MSQFSKQEENNILQNPDAVRESSEMLAEVLTQFLSKKQSVEEKTYTDDEKRKAAYALNLCTVSVSQIVDYNDLQFLEQEYEAILNNLNLEEMPKDEALLRILKQLLDVINYFRIEEGEKKLLEKEYQQKMKNAIWNAVPNIGLVVAGGNPVTMAVSLASQVGIGYMNYRKEKAKIGLEQERKEWELQRSAMEQFNGLRRELFDTAWRLAEKYKFPDEYRLTERQITQYNRILMDPDDLRRYERLEYIQDNFKAYPPFWYYLGSAANAVWQNEKGLDENQRKVFKGKAKEHFEYFLNITKGNILREDQLEAACALELVDLLDDNKKETKLTYLSRAQKASGNAYDVLELCAVAYLKIGQHAKAEELLHMLVNEDYNTVVNAQLLSKIYAVKAIEAPEENEAPKGKKATTENEDPYDKYEKKYKILETRVDSDCLFPMPPKKGQNDELLMKDFIERQKDGLREKYAVALAQFIYKYSNKYEGLYKEQGDITQEMVQLMSNMRDAVKVIEPDEQAFPLLDGIQEDLKGFQNMLKQPQRDKNTQFTFKNITEKAFIRLAAQIKNRVNGMKEMSRISEAESQIDQFCTQNSLTKDFVSKVSGKVSNPIVSAICNDEYEKQLKRMEEIEKCKKKVEEITKGSPVVKKEKGKRQKTSFYIKGSFEFENYIKSNRKALSRNYRSVEKIIAIVNDTGILNQWDLIVCVDGVLLFDGKKAKGFISYSEYSNESCFDGNTLKFGRGKRTSFYKNGEVDMEVLRKIIEELINIHKEYEDSSNEVESLAESVKNKIFEQPSVRDKNSGPSVSRKEDDRSEKKEKYPTRKIRVTYDVERGEYNRVVWGRGEFNGPIKVNDTCLIDGDGYYDVKRIIIAERNVDEYDPQSEEVVKFHLEKRRSKPQKNESNKSQAKMEESKKARVGKYYKVSPGDAIKFKMMDARFAIKDAGSTVERKLGELRRDRDKSEKKH